MTQPFFHPTILLIAALVAATVLAWWPGFIARRHNHPYAAAINIVAVVWLLVSMVVLWFRPDLSVAAAVAWAVITLAAYVQPCRPA